MLESPAIPIALTGLVISLGTFGWTLYVFERKTAAHESKARAYAWLLLRNADAALDGLSRNADRYGYMRTVDTEAMSRHADGILTNTAELSEEIRQLGERIYLAFLEAADHIHAGRALNQSLADAGEKINTAERALVRLRDLLATHFPRQPTLSGAERVRQLFQSKRQGP